MTDHDEDVIYNVDEFRLFHIQLFTVKCCRMGYLKKTLHHEIIVSNVPLGWSNNGLKL